VRKRTIQVTHRDNLDTLLVRIGHHLWHAYKEAQRNQQLAEQMRCLDACADLWRVKREYRAPRAVTRQAGIERLKAHRYRTI